MAKKVRRARRLSAAQTYQPSAESAESTASTASAATTTMQAPGRSSSRTVDFREEYPHILSDLQRIGILAAAILSGLVILSFFIK